MVPAAVQVVLPAPVQGSGRQGLVVQPPIPSSWAPGSQEQTATPPTLWHWVW